MVEIRGKRASGKTTALIYASAISGYPIMVTGAYKCGLLKERAKSLGVKIPEPLVADGNHRGKAIKGVLVDDAEMLLSWFVNRSTGGELVAYTISEEDDT